MYVAACSLILLSNTRILRDVSKIGECFSMSYLILASMSYQLIVWSQMSVSEILFKANATTCVLIKVRNRAKIKNRYNQAPHLTQDTNGKVTTSQSDITNESQEVIPFPAGDHKTSTNRRA